MYRERRKGQRVKGGVGRTTYSFSLTSNKLVIPEERADFVYQISRKVCDWLIWVTCLFWANRYGYAVGAP